MPSHSLSCYTLLRRAPPSAWRDSGVFSCRVTFPASMVSVRERRGWSPAARACTFAALSPRAGSTGASRTRWCTGRAWGSPECVFALRYPIPNFSGRPRRRSAEPSLIASRQSATAPLPIPRKRRPYTTSGQPRAPGWESSTDTRPAWGFFSMPVISIPSISMNSRTIQSAVFP